MAELSMCLIIKNEIHNIEGLMGDLLPIAEEVNVVDTGSTDGTLQKLEELAVKFPNLKLYNYTWNDHFSEARNFAFSKATKSWIGWCDGDDRLDPKSLAKFKNEIMDDPGVDIWLMDYHYAFLPNGEPSITLGRERFLRKSINPRWVGAIHECVDAVFNMRTRNYPDLKFVHKREGKVIDHKRNLRILEKEYAKNPNDARTVYYYGKELFDSVDPRGIEILEKYLVVPGRWYDDEVNARFRLAKHYISVGRHTEAVNMAEKIYHVDGSRRRAEAYWVWGRVEQDLRNYAVAIDWYERCLKEPPESPRVLGLEYYTWNPRWRMAECYESLGQNFKALELAQEAQKMIKGNQELAKLVNKLQPKPVGTLRVLQYGSTIRLDGISVPSDFKGELQPGTFDGLTTTTAIDPHAADLVKPGGFLWSVPQFQHPEFQYLGSCKYENHVIRNYIKVNPKLASISSNIDPVETVEFGPLRLRVQTMLRAAVKAGHRVSKGDVLTDIYISDRLTGNEPAKHVIIDVCEELPLESYLHKGLVHADLITTSSSRLADYVRRLCKQPVTVVDDSFEFSPREWL